MYVRPGAVEYIKRLQSHPRIIFAFYTSLGQKNAKVVLDCLKTNGVDFGNHLMFHQEVCTYMNKSKRLQ